MLLVLWRIVETIQTLFYWAHCSRCSSCSCFEVSAWQISVRLFLSCIITEHVVAFPDLCIYFDVFIKLNTLLVNKPNSSGMIRTEKPVVSASNFAFFAVLVSLFKLQALGGCLSIFKCQVLPPKTHLLPSCREHLPLWETLEEQLFDDLGAGCSEIPQNILSFVKKNLSRVFFFISHINWLIKPLIYTWLIKIIMKKLIRYIHNWNEIGHGSEPKGSWSNETETRITVISGPHISYGESVLTALCNSLHWPLHKMGHIHSA